jgi:hypothetical protein
MALAWIALIFAVRPNDDAGIYIVACSIGILGFLLLPVGLELGCEITRHAEGSAACLWMAGNLWTLIFVLGMFRLIVFFTRPAASVLVLMRFGLFSGGSSP